MIDLKWSFCEKIFPGFPILGIKLPSTQGGDGAPQTHFFSSGKLLFLSISVRLSFKTLVFQEKKQDGVQMTSLNKQQSEMNGNNKQHEVEPVEVDDEA